MCIKRFVLYFLECKIIVRPHLIYLTWFYLTSIQAQSKLKPGAARLLPSFKDLGLRREVLNWDKGTRKLKLESQKCIVEEFRQFYLVSLQSYRNF